MIFLTTTAIELDERASHSLPGAHRQRGPRADAATFIAGSGEQQTIEGLLKRLERKSIIGRHQNAQRLLKPLFVANPFAHELTFPDHLTRFCAATTPSI